ncbi:zinc finger protein 836-like [Pseudophryne corroboree]|uniref:zinc finger protein 836-like n=1 Tax=Pseudophryne corroboree TaxID=495146 RepID=UPI003081471D
MMTSPNQTKQYHQPWTTNYLDHSKEWTEPINPMYNSVTRKQVWASGIEPLERETCGLLVSQQSYGYRSDGTDMREEPGFPILYNYFDNMHRKCLPDDVTTSHWIATGTELIKLDPGPISRSFLTSPWNVIQNSSEAMINYGCDVEGKQTQHSYCGNPSMKVVKSTDSDIASARDSYCIKTSSSSDICSQDQPSMMSISDFSEDGKVEMTNTHPLLPITQNRALQYQLKESETCFTEENKFLLIDAQGVPYTVFKKDLVKSPNNSDEPAEISLQVPRKFHYCLVCFRSFLYVSDLERHSITHSERKPFDCKVCGKSFKRSSHLQRHKHIHTGDRPFLCDICQKGFRESGELQRHQRVHTGEKPYQCELCYLRFTERNTLRRHIKRKHPTQFLHQQDAGDSSDWEENLK